MRPTKMILQSRFFRDDQGDGILIVNLADCLIDKRAVFNESLNDPIQRSYSLCSSEKLRYARGFRGCLRYLGIVG